MGNRDSFVAIGDSFTEGLDDWLPDGSARGWADRVADVLGEGRAGFRYANLAVRGKLLDEIAAEQVPEVERLRPDLVTLAAGGNDIIRLSCDVDDLAARFDTMLARVVATGAETFVFTGFDLGHMHPLIRRLRGRVACYNESIRVSAERHGCPVVDLWGMHPLTDPRAWARDRLHLNPDAHRRVALRVLEILGEPVAEDWRIPLPTEEGRIPWRNRQSEDLRWMREFVMPHVHKQLRGIRIADSYSAKRPELLPLTSRSVPTG